MNNTLWICPSCTKPTNINRTIFRLLFTVCIWLGSAGLTLASDTGKLVEKDGKHVFVESRDPATKLLLDRAAKQGIITQEEYAQVVRESEERTYLMQPSFRGWYDRGFNLSMNDNMFFLKIRFRAQLRYTQR